ncbi:Cytochrome P450 monooxygenase [Lachnellula hyalina]|uniref:Cytochrome P450 monooxygenase n=1 Tax=Lachnellula hyalina TaxID=1316788 RepID=A0A8H8U0B7_9HELO|nr:Cytochrome P450 monooxygenase [Lachnellula hyalina]TVY28722.1 Cytochrome P450 monooxygenase [Lachnellula hyalina]
MESSISPPTILTALAATLLLTLTILLLSDLHTQHHLPPGPLPLPFIGNLLLLLNPNRKAHEVFRSLGHTYGPIFTFWHGREPQLVISDPATATSLLEAYSAIFSSRPRLVMLSEIYYQGSGLFTQAYGREWTQRRRLMTHALRPALLKGYGERQDAEGSRLVAELAAGVEWKEAFERYAASIIFSTAYGRSINTLSSSVVREKKAQVQNFLHLAVPGRYWAETFPALIYMPDFLAPWKKAARRMGDDDAALNRRLVEDVRVQGKSAGDSLTKTLLTMDAEKEVSGRAFTQIPGALFSAGLDTTMSALSTFLLALLTHPHILSFARSEIDTVIGRTRAPVLEDEPALPYITALVREVLRWRPVTPFGIPHASTACFEWNGYVIPKGTVVLASHWNISMNDEYYPLPELFEPSRFLSREHPRSRPEFKGREHPHKIGHNAFGWGRRICPGEALATNTIFVAVAKMIWALDFETVEGETYNVDDYVGGLTVRPRDFNCVVKVRGAERIKVIERERIEAQKVMEAYPPYD